MNYIVKQLSFLALLSPPKSLILLSSYIWNVIVGKDGSKEADTVPQLRDGKCLNWAEVNTAGEERPASHGARIGPQPMFVKRVKCKCESTCEF